ncbi:alpha/beta hydrolase [Streptomyces sp. NRRL S-378]|uniref:alpha/beta hydrolase n=1 Tax=Streptomyces sp. NRRL S-378 TaxID=1463904 RepID=UPI000A63AB04|nr:alpha/beta hydrolase [Streptomyces sp. NRRL S-378]
MLRAGRTTSILTAGAATAVLVAFTPAAAFAVQEPLEEFGRQHLRWERCAPDQPTSLECTTVQVPLDYADPHGRSIQIAVSRVKAASAAKRRGVLLMNPGGPGGPGLTTPAGMAPLLAPEVRERYDLIGFDPRGVGRSTPVRCGLAADEQVLNHPYSADTFGRDMARARSVADKCRAKSGDLLPHITTRNTARDMDVIRAALGERKISYLGHSYGTYLGAVYTQMFPRRADRFVLDSALDPALVWRGVLRGATEAAELAFTRWTEWAAARDATYGLGATPQAVRAAFWDLVARADRTPIVLEGQPFDGDAIRAQYRAFVQVEAVTPFIVALRAAEAGAAAPAGPSTAVPTAAEAAGEAPDVDNVVSVAWAVLCGEGRSWPRDPEQYRRDALRDRAARPLAGDFGANIQPCAYWKSAPREAATVVDNDADALIVQNEWDPQTPLAMAKGMRRALHGARMVTVAGGEGHGVLGTGRPSCAETDVTRYLTTGRLPEKDRTCT